MLKPWRAMHVPMAASTETTEWQKILGQFLFERIIGEDDTA
jgi:hypothetical protein